MKTEIELHAAYTPPEGALVTLHYSFYPTTGMPSLDLHEADGCPYARASVNPSLEEWQRAKAWAETHYPGEIVMFGKDYSENEGIWDCLEELDLAERLEWSFISGFVMIDLWLIKDSKAKGQLEALQPRMDYISAEDDAEHPRHLDREA